MHSPASSPAPSRRWRVLRVVAPVIVALVLAAAYLVVAGSGVLAMFSPVGDWAIPLTLAVQAGLLALRYRWPLAIFIAVVLLDIPLLVVSNGELTVGSFAIMVVAYTLRRALPAARAYAWILAALAVTWVTHYVTLGQSTQIAEEWRFVAATGQAVATYAVALVIAEAVIAQGRLSTILRERAELAERDRDRSASEAIRQERNLIARELHDIAAHHLTGIILSSQAVNSLMATDPDRAREYLGTVQDEARTALDNVRQTVGLLRTDDETDLAPAPSIDDLPQLIADHRARGTVIEYASVGEPVPLGPIAGITVYRTVQEALANAGKHAPGSACTVAVAWTSEGLRVVIENGPAAGPVPDIPSGGNGLIGMRERAALVRGTIAVGPRVDGGWRAELTVPPPDNPPTGPLT